MKERKQTFRPTRKVTWSCGQLVTTEACHQKNGGGREFHLALASQHKGIAFEHILIETVPIVGMGEGFVGDRDP